MAKRLEVEPKSQTFDGSGSITIISFLPVFQMGWNTNSIHEGAEFLLLHVFYKESGWCCPQGQKIPNQLTLIPSGREVDFLLSSHKLRSQHLKHTLHNYRDWCLHYQPQGTKSSQRLWLLAIVLDEGLTVWACIWRVLTKTELYWTPSLVDP